MFYAFLMNLVLGFTVPSFAKEITNIPQIGTHQQIFIIEKNNSPENIAVVYTKVDKKCQFEKDPENNDLPVFDFYWLMGRKKYKPMASFFKGKFHERISFESSDSDRSTEFGLIANDLHEVDHDLEEPRLEIVSKVAGKGCDVIAYMNLGPSDGNVRIRLDSIYGAGNMFGTIYSITLNGEVVDEDGSATGEKVSRKYEAKN